MKFHSCSTFVLPGKNTLLVGHNLDDYVPSPGYIYINPRGIAKHNISWDDLRFTYMKSHSRCQWVSKYASLTCNAFGREFPDGGINEAGFYAGETTLLGSLYPSAGSRPKIYHHQWIQYLLDNFETVDQVLADLGNVVVEGHCQWHFFIADKSGQAAVIEFIQGKTIVHSGANLPMKILCNSAYAEEMTKLAEYEGFGGQKTVDFNDKTGPARFAQAAKMVRSSKDILQSPIDFAFSILEQLDCGNNLWQTVYDVHTLRLYYRTSLSKKIKNVSLSAFDLSGKSQAWMSDIHLDKTGDTYKDFISYDDKLNHQLIDKMWQGINLGFLLNTFFKPIMVKRLSNYPEAFKRERKSPE
jgi:penicillin V acylase-like amidase (Ntn superfamily)